jgi:uncharacterized protein (DUF1697 family)
MVTYAAFLRGINVGGNKTIQMRALKALMEAHGLVGVRTHLNSGNVVFASDEADRGALGASLEAAIEQEFGFRPAVMLRSAAELSQAIAKNPFPQMAKDDPSHLLVMFLAGKVRKSGAERLAAAYSGPEEIRMAGETAYITYAKGIGTSKLTNALLERHLGVAGTGRNWNTVVKLAEILDSIQSS